MCRPSLNGPLGDAGEEQLAAAAPSNEQVAVVVGSSAVNANAGRGWFVKAPFAGAIAQQNAEALAAITLSQLVRPGAPLIYGGFTSNVDMRSGSPAFGTPEYLHAVFASAQIGRRLRIPVRTSAVNASPTVDAQSTYESAFSLQAAVLSHSHLINHAAGWLEGGLSASLEKIVVDAELLRNWAEILKPVSFSDDDLAVDAIKEVAAGGHFFGSRRPP